MTERAFERKLEEIIERHKITANPELIYDLKGLMQEWLDDIDLEIEKFQEE